MSNKELVIHFSNLFNISSVNWAKEMAQVKRILAVYSQSELLIALSYWKNKGENIYTLGFFTVKKFQNIKEPLSLHNAEKAMESEETSGERNRKKLEQNNKADNGKKYFVDLFEES